MKKRVSQKHLIWSLLLTTMAFAINAQTVFINEIHYDNAGTDVDEAIEIAGPAGTDLNGWKVELYNGSNGTVYRTIDLATTLTDQAQGYGFLILNLPTNGLQNGAPDGLALIDASNSVIQFLSYEGVITATNGTAIGQTSTDIGIAEGSGTDIGASLQLTGTGVMVSDFSWEAFAVNTYSSINTGQSFDGIVSPPTSPTILINELDADTAGSDTLEFIELYDGGMGNTSLDGLVLVFYNGSNNLSYRTIDLTGFTTSETGYFVVGNEAVTNVDLVVPGNAIQNGADAVVLYSGAEADFPNGTAVVIENIVDAIVYDTNDADDPELLVVLNEGQPQLNEGMNDNKDSESLQRITNGSGGAQNTETYQAAEPTPGMSNDGDSTPPSSGLITIADARNAASGTTVTVTGTLTVTDQFAGSAYIQDSTGAIAIFDEMVHGENNFAIGDSITVTGVRSAFNDQLQLSNLTTVVDNGVATTPIVPLEITLVELEQHPAELVQVVNTTFPNPGDLLFGNANFELTDTSGSGQLRIDNDVAAVVGLAQPETCDVITGVVGRFRDFYQLLPRQTADIACAEAYRPIGNTDDIAKEDTFDIATWNIEWFGDEGNSPAAGNPMSDAIQRDSVRNVLEKLDADMIAVQEIADDRLFDELVSSLPGYDYILSEAISNPEGDGVKQKVGFIYKTSVVTPKTTRAMFRSIHPSYNGGDASALTNYPEGAADRFFASGRLPFLMTADVTIDGKTEEIDLIALHARANNSSNPQQRYDFRKFDVEVLKDSLDVNFANRNVILLGDYNDDIDVTVADVATTESTYQSFVDDVENYTIVSEILSEAGFRSFVSRNNMIDHILISNELDDNYIENSADVGYQFYDNDYSRTASDHLLVSARLFIGDDTQNQNTVTGFTLINAASNFELGVLSDGDVVNLSTLGTSYLSFAAQTNPEVVGSVALVLDGPVSATRTENVAPYTMFGDIPNLFFGRTLIPGSYTLTATPYTERLKRGEVGETAQIQFTIVDDSMIAVVAPNPISNNEVVVNFAEVARSTQVSYQLTNQMGATIAKGQLTIHPGQKTLRLDASAILVDKGIYYLTVIAEGQQLMLKVLR